MCSRCSICRLFFCDIFRDFLSKLKIRKSPANKDVRAQLLSHSFLIPWCARLSPRHPAKMCHKESLWLRLCRFARRKKIKSAFAILLCTTSSLPISFAIARRPFFPLFRLLVFLASTIDSARFLSFIFLIQWDEVKRENAGLGWGMRWWV